MSITSSSGTYHEYSWCGQARCFEFNGAQSYTINGQLVAPVDAAYFTEGEVDYSTGNAVTVYDVADVLGSERMTVNQSCSIIAEYEYDPYGTRTKVAGTGQDSEKGYAGLWYEPVSGMQFSRTRAYSAQLGRWMTRDPLGSLWPLGAGPGFSATGLNLYAYGMSNPTSMVDPSGLDPIALPLAGLGLAGASGDGAALWAVGAVGAQAGIIALGAVSWFALPGQVMALANEWDTDALLGNGFFATPQDLQSIILQSGSEAAQIERWAQQLGLPRKQVGNTIEKLKDAAGLTGKQNVDVEPDGTVTFEGEPIGNVYDEDCKKKR